MDAWQSFKRKREMRKVRRAAGVKAGRGGRRASGGRMVVHPKEPADVHALMAQDAQPNIRVWQMWDEACDFEHELNHFRENLSKFENATDEFLKRIEPIMRVPLPRVWDSVEGGLAEPTRATISHGHQHTVGGDVSIAGLEESRIEYHNRLRGHVVRPLHQWSEALGVVEERLPELKRLRGDVIKSSREAARSGREYKSRSGDMERVEDAGGAGAMVPYKGGGGGGGGIRGVFGACSKPQVGAGSRHGPSRRQRGREDAIEDDYYTSSSDDDDDVVRGRGRDAGVDRTTRREIEMEEAGMKLNYKHRKLQAVRADYAEAERLIAEQLTGLQRDAAWTKSYMVSALLLTKECMQTAVVSLGNTKQPLPGFQSHGPQLAQRHGELNSNVDLAASMPEDVNIELFETHIRGGQSMTSLGGGGGIMAALPAAHAHKSTAAPMELAARPDVRELDRVATPPSGAGAIPVGALAGLGLEDTTAPVGIATTSGYRRREEGEAYYATSPTSTNTSLRNPRFSETSNIDSEAPSVGRSVGGTGAGGVSGGGLGGGLSGVSPVIGGGAGGVSVVRQDQSEHVCSRRSFTEVEDRPVVRERVERIVEHRPVEKQYVTELKYVGEAPLGGSTEHLDTRTRVVGVTPPGPKCPSGAETSALDTTAATAAGGSTATHGIGSRRHRHRRGGSSSSSSSSSSSGDEHEGDRFDYKGSKGFSRAHGVSEATPLSGGGLHSHGAGVGEGGRAAAAVREAQVASVLREDNTEAVCGRQEFTQTEDRPVVRERVEKIVEHRPVEKQYVTELRYDGEKELPGSREPLGHAEERIVDVAAPGRKCPRGICQGACDCEPVVARAPAGVDDAGIRNQQVAV